ncbi:MAG: ABC transporter ATP-binding protein [Anaerolineae bacterium]|nr:ABC transporter ATP-binding protein [Anaerolineae bacterium]
MLRLIKYLKPFRLMILLAIGLLFVQAMADLSLPDYMSRIVNVGIQQSGVEDAVPEAIRESQLDKLLLFLDESEGDAVRDAYMLVNAGSPDYARYVEDYPALASEPVYVLRDPGAAESAALNSVLAKGLLVVSTIEQLAADPESAAGLGGEMPFDLSKLPPGMDVFTLLAQLPAAQRSQLQAGIDERFAAMGENMIIQSAIVAVRAEYEALGMDTARLQNRYILRTGALMLLLTFVAAACIIAVGYLSARSAAGVARDLRRALFRKVTHFSNAEFDSFSTASLITRTTNDITQIQMVVVIMIRMVFYSPIIGIGGVIRAGGKGSSMWWIIALAVAALIALIFGVFQIAMPKFKKVQSLIDRLNLVMRENLSGMMVIRAFNNQAFERRRFEGANRDLTDTMLFVSRVIVVMMPVMMLIMNGLMLLIIWVGAHEVAQATMQVGDLMAFMQYALQIVMAFLMLSMLFIILPRASVSADRIADVLETELTITDPERPRSFPTPFAGEITFQNVSFRYPGAEENVLCNLNFTARPGETTAIIGSTGSGKSTLVNLLPRFYDVTGGAILIDGVDIREVAQRELRDKIGFIPQKGVLFSGTIESNLRYADEAATPETLRMAADIAQVVEFIDAKPEGMASEIAQGGANVSGGQKQRLAIARALVKRPPIYIFDDSFSALDFRTDAALRRALKEQTGESTVLIVTQRVSTIRHAEQIVVLDEGEIVGQGTHEDLMAGCETYREIALSQLKREELA